MHTPSIHAKINEEKKTTMRRMNGGQVCWSRMRNRENEKKKKKQKKND